MSEPRRIQRKRTKGWRMPDGAVYVGRPSRWGNAFAVGDTCTVDIGYPHTFTITDAQQAVNLFANWQLDGSLRYAAIRELRGRDLACWCPLDQPCHADVLLEMANR